MNSEISEDDIVIVAARRTAIGSFQGMLSSVAAPFLGANAIAACLNDIGLRDRASRQNLPATAEFTEAFMGCVLSAGQGQAPARQAVLGAGLPSSVGATTINKMCGSGMQAVIASRDTLRCGDGGAMIAGGMESMSNAPYLIMNARRGFRMGHGRLIDHMLLDGLEDSCEHIVGINDSADKVQDKSTDKSADKAIGKSMGVFAEETALASDISRKDMDDFSIRSLEEAQRANRDGSFAAELSAVSIRARDGTSTMFAEDEQPFKGRVDKIRKMKGAFVADGRVTSANSSSISDGASALILTSRSFAERSGWRVLGRIVSSSSHAREASRFTLAPIDALRKLSTRSGWSLDEVDLFEINEAFAVVTLATMRALALPLEKVNINGGACALGHPIGASGARIIVTLLHALHHRGLKRGMAAICIGGGEALALALEVE